ncbi:MAG TPA: hypothetical protein VFE46_07850 [Pirellulales bacterium]|jgi:hypothetical protein|nr:hypothetical protein [Pirellulales bacterium]
MSISNAFRVAAAEKSIAHHKDEIDPRSREPYCTKEDAEELLKSMALWAELNGFCLKVPKPAYAGEAEETGAK